MNLISYLKVNMHNKLSLVMLTYLLGCFTTIHSMELTKTQPVLLQKLSALSQDPEVRRVAKFVAIGAGVCAATLGLKKLLQSPEPAPKPALMTVHPQPVQATAASISATDLAKPQTDGSAADSSGATISSDQRAINNLFAYFEEKYRCQTTLIEQRAKRRTIFDLMVFIDSVGIEGTGFNRVAQETEAQDLAAVIDLANKGKYYDAYTIMSQAISARTDSRKFAQPNEQLWDQMRKGVFLRPEDRVIRLKSFLEMRNRNGSRKT